MIHVVEDLACTPTAGNAARSATRAFVRFAAGVAVVLLLLPRIGFGQATGGSANAASTAGAPWRITSALPVPSWFYLGVAQRTRYEYLSDQFRIVADGSDTALALRTLVATELRFSPLVFGAEFQDARMYLLDDDIPLDTTHINAVELLQAYAGADLREIFVAGDAVRLRGGRLTMDVGNRRLVARNAFRNTINAFTGVDAEWTAAAGDAIRLFATFPVQRRPTSRAALEDNDIQFDRESSDGVFWGAFYRSRPWAEGMLGEIYVFGLHEDDSTELATANRDLYTPGLRIYRVPARDELDLELETAIQLGSSRASTRADDGTDLDHRAFFFHAALGYTFDAFWIPRLVLQYDYASGDSDPDDRDNGRFDTLFGARRFEFGPTGIYGAFARSNINSPGMRVEVKPHGTVNGFVGYRPVWLAAERDAWVTTGVRDPSGGSGSFLGNQIETAVSWQAIPGNVAFEIGVAHIWSGEFATDAPNANGETDPTYFYVQFELKA